MENPWEGLEQPGYRIENLGRTAVFLIPSTKLKMPYRDTTIENDLHEFLMKEFGAFRNPPVPDSGFWRNVDARIVYDECRVYIVAFLGKERIPILFSKLVEIARYIGEACLYVEAGQYSGLLRPE